MECNLGADVVRAIPTETYKLQIRYCKPNEYEYPSSPYFFPIQQYRIRFISCYFKLLQHRKKIKGSGLPILVPFILGAVPFLYFTRQDFRVLCYPALVDILRVWAKKNLNKFSGSRTRFMVILCSLCLFYISEFPKRMSEIYGIDLRIKPFRSQRMAALLVWQLMPSFQVLFLHFLIRMPGVIR